MVLQTSVLKKDKEDKPPIAEHRKWEVAFTSGESNIVNAFQICQKGSSGDVVATFPDSQSSITKEKQTTGLRLNPVVAAMPKRKTTMDNTNKQMSLVLNPS